MPVIEVGDGIGKAKEKGDAGKTAIRRDI